VVKKRTTLQKPNSTNDPVPRSNVRDLRHDDTSLQKRCSDQIVKNKVNTAEVTTVRVVARPTPSAVGVALISLVHAIRLHVTPKMQLLTMPC